MFIHVKQERVYSLVILLLDYRPMTSAELTKTLQCSSATLTRTIRDARESYGVRVEFKKERQRYEISNAEELSEKDLEIMRTTVKDMDERAHRISVINLKRIKKKPVSLSLPIKLLQRLDKAAKDLSLNRSDAVSFLLESKLEEMMFVDKKRNS